MLFPRSAVAIADGANLDAFSRLRVSNVQGLFDAQFTYGIAPLLFEPITNGSGATVAHDATNRLALCTFSSTPTGGKAYMQTFECFRYQPGKSQLVFVTFNFVEQKADVLKFAGYSDGVNGIEFQNNGTRNQLVLYSDTANGDQTVAQADWNIDKLNGTGASGLTLAITNTQILVIDLQALYVGRVRVGFDIDGQVVYVHEFLHANRIATPYAQSVNLPVRCGMTCTATVSTTMQFVCCSVSSEGGVDDTAGYSFSVEGTATAGSATRTHLLSVQPATTFNSIQNRTRFVLESLDIVVSGNFPVSWEMSIGQALTGAPLTFTAVNATYSAMESNTAGALSGSPAITIAQGYVASTAQVKQQTSTRVPMRYPITLDAAGAVRVNGRLTVCATGVGGASATRAVLNWKEIR